MNNNESGSNEQKLEQDPVQETNSNEMEQQQVQSFSSTQEDNQPPAAKKSGVAGWIVSAILLVALIVVLVKPIGGGSETVATVNGSNIKKDALYDVLVEGANGQNALEMLILEELVQQEADAASIKLTEEDITAEIDAIKFHFPAEGSFEASLTQNGVTMEDLRKDIRPVALMHKILEPKTDIKDEDVQKYFDDNIQQFSTQEEVEASHILVEKKEDADAILAELKNGADFAEKAKEKSIDGSKDTGGQLGYFTKDRMVPEFANAAFALKVGEISEVVQSQHGYHIIKKTGEKPAITPTFEESKAVVRTILVGNETNALSNEWIQTIRDKAKITNSLVKEEPKEEVKPSSEPEEKPEAEASEKAE